MTNQKTSSRKGGSLRKIWKSFREKKREEEAEEDDAEGNDEASDKESVESGKDDESLSKDGSASTFPVQVLIGDPKQKPEGDSMATASDSGDDLSAGPAKDKMLAAAQIQANKEPPSEVAKNEQTTTQEKDTVVEKPDLETNHGKNEVPLCTDPESSQKLVHPEQEEDQPMAFLSCGADMQSIEATAVSISNSSIQGLQSISEASSQATKSLGDFNTDMYKKMGNLLGLSRIPENRNLELGSVASNISKDGSLEPVSVSSVKKTHRGSGSKTIRSRKSNASRSRGVPKNIHMRTPSREKIQTIDSGDILDGLEQSFSEEERSDITASVVNSNASFTRAVKTNSEKVDPKPKAAFSVPIAKKERGGNGSDVDTILSSLAALDSVRQSISSKNEKACKKKKKGTLSQESSQPKGDLVEDSKPTALSSYDSPSQQAGAADKTSGDDDKSSEPVKPPCSKDSDSPSGVPETETTVRHGETVSVEPRSNTGNDERLVKAGESGAGGSQNHGGEETRAVTLMRDPSQAEDTNEIEHAVNATTGDGETSGLTKKSRRWIPRFRKQSTKSLKKSPTSIEGPVGAVATPGEILDIEGQVESTEKAATISDFSSPDGKPAHTATEQENESGEPKTSSSSTSSSEQDPTEPEKSSLGLPPKEDGDAFRNDGSEAAVAEAHENDSAVDSVSLQSARAMSVSSSPSNMSMSDNMAQTSGSSRRKDSCPKPLESSSRDPPVTSGDDKGRTILVGTVTGAGDQSRVSDDGLVGSKLVSLPSTRPCSSTLAAGGSQTSLGSARSSISRKSAQVLKSLLDPSPSSDADNSECEVLETVVAETDEENSTADDVSMASKSVTVISVASSPSARSITPNSAPDDESQSSRQTSRSSSSKPNTSLKSLLGPSKIADDDGEPEVLQTVVVETNQDLEVQIASKTDIECINIEGDSKSTRSRESRSSRLSAKSTGSNAKPEVDGDAKSSRSGKSWFSHGIEKSVLSGIDKEGEGRDADVASVVLREEVSEEEEDRDIEDDVKSTRSIKSWFSRSSAKKASKDENAAGSREGVGLAGTPAKETYDEGERDGAIVEDDAKSMRSSKSRSSGRSAQSESARVKDTTPTDDEGHVSTPVLPSIVETAENVEDDAKSTRSGKSWFSHKSKKSATPKAKQDEKPEDGEGGEVKTSANLPKVETVEDKDDNASDKDNTVANDDAKSTRSDKRRFSSKGTKSTPSKIKQNETTEDCQVDEVNTTDSALQVENVEDEDENASEEEKVAPNGDAKSTRSGKGWFPRKSTKPAALKVKQNEKTQDCEIDEVKTSAILPQVETVEEEDGNEEQLTAANGEAKLTRSKKSWFSRKITTKSAASKAKQDERTEGGEVEEVKTSASLVQVETMEGEKDNEEQRTAASDDAKSRGSRKSWFSRKSKKSAPAKTKQDEKLKDCEEGIAKSSGSTPVDDGGEGRTESVEDDAKSTRSGKSRFSRKSAKSSPAKSNSDSVTLNAEENVENEAASVEQKFPAPCVSTTRASNQEGDKAIDDDVASMVSKKSLKPVKSVFSEESSFSNDLDESTQSAMTYDSCNTPNVFSPPSLRFKEPLESVGKVTTPHTPDKPGAAPEENSTANKKSVSSKKSALSNKPTSSSSPKSVILSEFPLITKLTAWMSEDASVSSLSTAQREASINTGRNEKQSMLSSKLASCAGSKEHFRPVTLQDMMDGNDDDIEDASIASEDSDDAGPTINLPPCLKNRNVS